MAEHLVANILANIVAGLQLHLELGRVAAVLILVREHYQSHPISFISSSLRAVDQEQRHVGLFDDSHWKVTIREMDGGRHR